MTDSGVPDPDRDVLTVLVSAGTGLTPEQLQQAITAATPSFHNRRKLAAALAVDPGLLACGRPDGPRVVDRLINALLELGAIGVVQPTCPHCGNATQIVGRVGGLRVCGPCRRRATAQPCSICSRQAQAYVRSRDGRPVCERCYTKPIGDPTLLLIKALAAFSPTAGQTSIQDAVADIGTRGGGYHLFRLLWEVQDHPERLTGGGADASPRLSRLITALVSRAVPGVVAPACPGCGVVRRLAYRVASQWCCGRCYRAATLRSCGRCGVARYIVTRTEDGTPLCDGCWSRDESNRVECAICLRVGPGKRRPGRPHVCGTCSRPVAGYCALCGAAGEVHRAGTGMARCAACAALRETCVACATTGPVAARTPDGPLCPACWATSPQAFKTCRVCRVLEHLHGHGLCERCALDDKLRTLLSSAAGMRADMVPVHALLVSGSPTASLHWIGKPAVQTMLRSLASGATPLTHGGLDTHRDTGIVRHFRAAMTDAGILAARDERLARLLRWITQTTQDIADDHDRRLVHRFATWHHLRRIRKAAAAAPLTNAQINGVKRSLRAALALLEWLRAHGERLDSCKQSHVDEWVEAAAATRGPARGFLQWCTANGHAPKGLSIAVPMKKGYAIPLNDDERWAMARLLLNETRLSVQDRVAGLLILLYAQKLTAICALPSSSVTSDTAGTWLTLGKTPLLLPPQLGQIVLDLLDDRRGYAATGYDGGSPWLFPGGFAGQHLSPAHLGRRLRTLGLRILSGRTAALLDLSAQLPASVLTRLLGIGPETAADWTAAAGRWANYGGTRALVPASTAQSPLGS